MVGEALYPSLIFAAREDLITIEVFKDPKHLQRVAVERLAPKRRYFGYKICRKDVQGGLAGSNIG